VFFNISCSYGRNAGMVEIIKPQFPGIVIENVFRSYPYLASAELDVAMLNGCVKEAVVTNIASITDNTVDVLYDGNTYTDVPVWIHTDYGCRANKLTETELSVASGYFARAANLFTLKADVYHSNIKPKIGVTPPGSFLAESRDPRVLVITYIDESNITHVTAVISVIDNGVYDPAYLADRRTQAPPSFKPYLLLKEKLGVSTYTCSLFDFATDASAEIPNDAYDAFVTAESIDPDDYDHFFDGGIEEYFSINYTRSYCHVPMFPDSPNYEATGYMYQGGCTCLPVVRDDDDVLVSWIVDDRDISTVVCSGTSHTVLDYFLAHTACGAEDGTFEHIGTGGCSGVYYLDRYTVTETIPSSVLIYSEVTGFPDASIIAGKREITWDSRIRKDIFNVSIIGTYEMSGTSLPLTYTTNYTITARINDVTLVFSRTSPDGPDGSEIIFESIGTMFFSFSLVQLIMLDSAFSSFGDVQHDYTPTVGIFTTNLNQWLADRYFALKTADSISTLSLELRIVFIPYDIREAQIV